MKTYTLPMTEPGEECHRYDCHETFMLHGITWRCGMGHLEILRYCSAHIDFMMELALTAPGQLPNGTYLGQMLCRICGTYTHPVLEKV